MYVYMDELTYCILSYSFVITMIFQKPFLKWVGGKTQLMSSILSYFPKEMKNYHEPFVGGGSVLLAVLSLHKQKKLTIHGKIYAYDVNPALIHVYKNIQSHPVEIADVIKQYITEYDSIKGNIIKRDATTVEEARTSKESYYYWLRAKYNKMKKDTVECSALFIILNKLCFRGMYREGPKGFNVPFGHYKRTPNMSTETEIIEISTLIKDVIFQQMSFETSLPMAKTGDFVYLDPPYAPENATSFVGYVAGGFDLDCHKKLFSAIKKWEDVMFVMSNAKVNLVTKSFEEYTCVDVVARRAINAKHPGSTTTEVLVCNL